MLIEGRIKVCVVAAGDGALCYEWSMLCAGIAKKAETRARRVAKVIAELLER